MDLLRKHAFASASTTSRGATATAIMAAKSGSRCRCRPGPSLRRNGLVGVQGATLGRGRRSQGSSKIGPSPKATASREVHRSIATGSRRPCISGATFSRRGPRTTSLRQRL